MPAKRGKKKTKEKTKDVELEILHPLIESLGNEVEYRIQSMQHRTATLQDAVQQVLFLQLASLPKQVLQMPLKQFCKEFQGELTAVLDKDLERRSEEIDIMKENISADADAIMATTRKKSKLQQKDDVLVATTKVNKKNQSKTLKSTKVAATPLTRSRAHTLTTPLNSHNIQQTPSATLNPFLPKTPAPCQRIPKRGETLLSVNNSPLGAITNRVTLNVNNSTFNASDDMLQIGIETEKGIVVDLSSSNAMSMLSENDKKVAAEKLKSMTADLESLLQQLES